MSTTPIAAARRSTEFGLVLFAAVIIAAAYTLASVAKDSQIPPRIVPFLAIVIGLLVFAHLANRALAKGADGTLLPLAVILHGIGYVMITRLDPEDLAGLQTTWSIIAIVVFTLTLAIVQRAPDLARYRWTFLAMGVVLLLLPLVPGLGTSVGGARIWVSVGPINFQPGEFAKLALAIFFVFGAHAFIWGTTSVTVRQRAVPLEFQGRVGGVNLVGVFGGLVLGSGIGGVLAQHWGVTAPFWFGFVGSAVFVMLIWRQLAHIAHADEEAPAPA